MRFLLDLWRVFAFNEDSRKTRDSQVVRTGMHSSSAEAPRSFLGGAFSVLDCIFSCLLFKLCRRCRIRVHTSNTIEAHQQNSVAGRKSVAVLLQCRRKVNELREKKPAENTGADQLF